MRVVFTDDARRDLDDSLAFLAVNYPALSPMFEARLRATLRRIGT